MMTIPQTRKLNYGTVDQPMTANQPGRIKFRGSYWKAELAYPDCRSVERGETVQVIGVQGTRCWLYRWAISRFFRSQWLIDGRAGNCSRYNAFVN